MARIDEFLARLGRYALAVRRKDTSQYKFARMVTDHMKWSAEQAREKQFLRLSAIIEHVYLHSRFYRKRFETVGFEPGDLKDFSDLQRLPELTRTDLRDNSNELVSDNIPPDQLEKSVTGGTTGDALSFYRDRHCLDYRRGIDLALARYYGWRDGQWQGLLWGAPRDLFENRGWKQKIVQYWATRVYAMDSSRLSNTTYEEFVTQTKKSRPSFILAYPSLAFDLAERIESGHVSPVRVPVICVTAEPFYEHQRQKIESVLADRAYARYGTREFGTAAFECPRQNGYHIITESVYIEVVPTGVNATTGAILVTDLLNKGTPLIRYRVADLASLDESPCDCGLAAPRLLQIQGRETDIIWRPDGTGVAGPEIHTMAEHAGLAAKAQVIQEKLDEIVLRVEAQGSDHQAEVHRLLEIFRREIGTDIHYRLERVSEIERAPSGKYRYVISKVNRPQEEKEDVPGFQAIRPSEDENQTFT